MISVVIPLYNKRDTIARAVQSVQAQTFTDWELIVIDDGSTDAGSELVAAFDDARVRLVQQRNAGVSVARNAGVALARSELVALLDADDYWDPEHLANMWRLIEEFPGASLYGCVYKTVAADGSVRRIRVRDDLPTRSLLVDYFAEACVAELPLQTSAVVLSRLALQSVGGFPPGVASGEDMITWARLACAGRVAYCTEATTYYELPPMAADARQRFARRPAKPDHVVLGLEALMQAQPQRAASIGHYLAAWLRICAMLELEMNERMACVRGLVRAAMRSRLTLKDCACLALLLLPQRPRGRVLARIRIARRRYG